MKLRVAPLSCWIFLLYFSTFTFANGIRGRVLNAEGAAVAGAKIILTDQRGEHHWEAVTTGDGSYEFLELERGSYVLTVAATGQEALRRNVTLEASSEPVTLNLQLVRAAARGPVAEVRNPNIFIYRIDLNDLRNRLTVSRGPDPQYIPEFQADQNYFGAEFGAALFRFEPVRPRSPLSLWHGSAAGGYENSALNARNFFNVGRLLPSRAGSYDLTAGGPFLQKRASLLMQFGQSFISGMVNGNLQAPQSSERVPLALDPLTRAIIARLLTAYPNELPNLPSVSTRQLNSNAPREVSSTDSAVAVDATLTDSAALAARYTINEYHEEPFQLVTGQNPQTDLRNQTVDLAINRTFASGMTGLFGFRFDRSKALLLPAKKFSELLAPLGITTAPDIQFSGSFNSYSPLGNIGPGSKFPRSRVQNRFHGFADFSRSMGHHTLKAGWSTARVQVNDLQSDNARGTLSFNAAFGRSAVENFLLGTPSSYVITLGNLYRGFRNWEHAFYVQDQIRLAPTFSLTAGVRYELMTAPYEVNNLTSTGFSTDKNNFAPRLGLAWNPAAGRTVIRAGYGISYGSILPVTYQLTRFNPPNVQVVQLSAPDLITALSGSKQVTPGGRSALNLLSPDLVFPYSHQYSLGVERQLPWASIVKAAYIGMRSFHLLSLVVLNRAQPVPGIPTTLTTVELRRPDPKYFAISVVESGSIAYYDALQLSWDKRLTKGLTFRATYTFGKAIDTSGDFTNTASGTETPPEIGTPQCEHCSHVADQKGVSLFDTPHNFAIAYSYNIPFRGGAGAWVHSILKGWQVSGTTNLQSGTAWHVHTGSDAPGIGNVDGFGQDRPNILNTSILGKSVDNPDTSTSIIRTDYFDTNLPPSGRGNLGMNTFRKDGTANWNFAVSRQFSFGGSRENSVLFRVQFFNFFNNPQFDKPGVNVADQAFGTITNTVNKGRQVQFSLRLSF